MNLEEQFQKAVEDSVKLTTRPPNRILLQLYSLYKQSTMGDIPTNKPEGLNFKDQAKFNAWERLKGSSPEKCMQVYIDLVESLKG